MSTQFLLIKPDKAERYNLWGRSGDNYFPDKFWGGSLKARGISEATRFKPKDAWPTKDDFILEVADQVIKYAPEWAGAPSQLDWAVELVEAILMWAQDDEVWWLADYDLDDWPWDKENGYKLPDGRAIRLTGSGYTNEKLETPS